MPTVTSSTVNTVQQTNAVMVTDSDVRQGLDVLNTRLQEMQKKSDENMAKLWGKTAEALNGVLRSIKETQKTNDNLASAMGELSKQISSSKSSQQPTPGTHPQTVPQNQNQNFPLPAQNGTNALPAMASSGRGNGSQGSKYDQSRTPVGTQAENFNTSEGENQFYTDCGISDVVYFNGMLDDIVEIVNDVIASKEKVLMAVQSGTMGVLGDYLSNSLFNLIKHKEKTTDKRSLFFFLALREYLLSQFAVGTQHIHNLVNVHLLHVLTGRLQVLARIEMIRMLSQILAHSSRHGQTRVRVDIDLANSTLRSFSQLLFGDTHSVGQIAAKLVDGVDLVLRHGRRTVEYDGEAGQFLLNLSQHIESQWRGDEFASLRITSTLLGFELICTMRSSD